MAHGADGDCFGAVRGLLVVKTAAGTAHTVGCACVLRAQVCEIHLCRAKPPGPRPPTVPDPRRRQQGSAPRPRLPVDGQRGVGEHQGVQTLLGWPA